MKHRFNLLLCTVLVVITTSRAFAEDPRGGFFEKDFATGSQFGDDRTTPSISGIEKELPSPTQVPEHNTDAPSGYDPKVKTEPIRQTLDIINRVKDISEGRIVIPNAGGKIEEMQQQLNRNRLDSDDSFSKDPLTEEKKAIAKRIGFEEQSKENNQPGITNQALPVAVTISIYVSAEPPTHIAKQLRTLRALARQKKIRVGGFFVIDKRIRDSGQRKLFIQEPSVLSELKAWPKDMPILLTSMENLPTQFQASSSPLWVIQYGEKRHLFEGNYNIFQLFNSNGDLASEYAKSPFGEDVIVHERIPSNIDFPTGRPLHAIDMIDYEERKAKGAKVRAQLLKQLKRRGR